MGRHLQPGNVNLIVGGSGRAVLGRMAARFLNFYEPDGIRHRNPEIF